MAKEILRRQAVISKKTHEEKPTTPPSKSSSKRQSSANTERQMDMACGSSLAQQIAIVLVDLVDALLLLMFDSIRLNSLTCEVGTVNRSNFRMPNNLLGF